MTVPFQFNPQDDPEYIEAQELLKEKYKNEIAQRERLRHAFFHTVEQLGKKEHADDIMKAIEYLVKVYARATDKQYKPKKGGLEH